MATSFSQLPIVDVGALKAEKLSDADSATLSTQLYDVFSTTGFAYLVNTPLSFDHDEIFGVAKEFFALPLESKMKLAKRSFRPKNKNTYRGYFPTQPLLAQDNLKEGFEIGNPTAGMATLGSKFKKFELSEPNLWPKDETFKARARIEEMYGELQAFASKLLSLLAVSLGQEADYFASWLEDSLSTFRLLHYPAVSQNTQSSESRDVEGSVKLSCTPHTDSGILTLLHQDRTGGLEVLNASGSWISAPYVSGSIVVNIGDLMAKVSGGRFTATMHRVRSPPAKEGGEERTGRFSIPFFFEPGERCVIRPIGGDQGDAVRYGEHVRQKMSTWVEFQDDSGYSSSDTT